MAEVLCVQNLCKSYGGKNAVIDLSLSMAEGEILGLLGANGAGKSTAIECILGVKERDGGEVSILGMDPCTERRKLFEHVGVQFQEPHYQNKITVKELCELTQSLYKRPQEYNELLKNFGLAGKEKQYVESLSGGERQRLFVVLALIPDPRLVILDELTTGLDTRARRDVWRFLEGLKAKGISILLTSHFMDEVEVLCDNICILKEGTTLFSGKMAEAIEKSPYDTMEDAYLWYTEEEDEI